MDYNASRQIRLINRLEHGALKIVWLSCYKLAYDSSACKIYG